MEKINIEVPGYVRYMSDWREYIMPQGHVIVDKGVTGCGYTEFCLRNDLNIVLCSPRKLLLENKSEQHLSDPNILYLENTIKDFDDSKKFEEKIAQHVIGCKDNGVPCKLLVTYDSMFRVAKVLAEGGLLNYFYFVVDEFQSIFLDSYYKADVELDFVEYLQGCPNVLYLSATPMLDKYLERVDEFKNLPMYKLDWSRTGIVEKVVIGRRFTSSLTKECSKIIQKEYLSGRFYTAVNCENKLIASKEAVFYFNSVSDIVRVIRKNKLHPDQVNIICANTDENKLKLSSLSTELFGKKSLGSPRFKIGKIPLKGQQNKMFTFCTKTAYIGSDFYSDNARSFVFADPNVASLALDISLDLAQIVGRQRDINNPFKNDVVIFYKTLQERNLQDKFEFLRLQESRRQETRNHLNIYNKIDNDSERASYLLTLRDSILKRKYSNSFTSISKHTGKPTFNTFIEIANERAWEVSQKEYQDIINVTKALEKVSTDITEYNSKEDIFVQRFLDSFNKVKIFREKLKLYCEFMDEFPESEKLEELIYRTTADDRFRRFYDYYGTEGCSARRFDEKALYDCMTDASKESELGRAIFMSFKVGDRISLKDIKERLTLIYQKLGILTRTPKATDLGKYFGLSRTRIKSGDKYVEGFKLTQL